MATKTLNTRIQQKSDTDLNWSKSVYVYSGDTKTSTLKASPFIPLKGEVIHYSTSDKIKIGNGTDNVEALEFIGGDSEGLDFDEVYNLTTLSSILPIANGGTGASTAAGARTALGLGSLATQSTVSIANGGTGAITAAAARANLGLGLLAVEDSVPIENGGTGATTAAGARTNLDLGDVALEDIVPVAKGGTGATTAAGARTNLDLGAAALEDIMPLAKGGTGATTAAGARTNLGIVNVSTTANGLMLADDKEKLDALPNIYISTSEPTSSDGSNGDIWIVYEA